MNEILKYDKQTKFSLYEYKKRKSERTNVLALKTYCVYSFVVTVETSFLARHLFCVQLFIIWVQFNYDDKKAKKIEE